MVYETTAFARSPYAVAKASAHWAVAHYRDAYGLHASTGILFNHELALPERFVTRKVVRAAVRIAAGQRERLRLGTLDIARDWGWASTGIRRRDVAHAGAAGMPDDYVIATGIATPLAEFVARTFAALDLDWRDHVEHDPSLRRPSDITRSCGDAAKARRLLGWQATTSLDTLIGHLIAAERRGQAWPTVASTSPSSELTPP